MRENRPKQKDMDPEAKKRANARAYAHVYLKRGKIEKAKNCQDCGKKGRLEMHHEDYSKPIDITWLCQNCHGKREGIKKS